LPWSVLGPSHVALVKGCLETLVVRLARARTLCTSQTAREWVLTSSLVMALPKLKVLKREQAPAFIIRISASALTVTIS
jgi:hypothetical protein